MDLHLIVTSACNLACTYCYQTAPREAARMSTEIAEAAVRIVLAAGDPPHRVVLSGGEPLLARDLVHQVIRSARDRAGESDSIDCVILSNGTLVNDDDLDLLAATDTELQLSFDGLGQDRRAPGSAVPLGRLIARTMLRHPSWARRRLSVAMMVQGATVSTLAASIRSLLVWGVAEIGVEPLATHDPDWTGVARERLRQQVEEVATDSLAHWGRTGRLPVTFLRKAARRRNESDAERSSPFVCGAPTGRNVAVDPRGRAWACPSFVASLQRLPPLGEEAATALHLGDVRHPDFSRRLADLPRRSGAVPLLRLSPERRSARGRCVDCPHAVDCLVCPAATCFVPGRRDPHWIPDNQCDFQWITLEERRRVQQRIAGASLLREMRRRTRALRRLARALDASSPVDRAGA